MCRLLGYVASSPTSVVEVLGERGLETFTSLTEVHGDGWGMAWREPDDPVVHTVTSPETAALDPAYGELTRRRLGPAGLVHLRWATGGLAVAPENTHPFTQGGFAFAHNGHIAPIARLEGLLGPEARSRLRGTTDSERYFQFVLQCMEEADDERSGFSHALGVLIREFPQASLNALMLSPTHIFAVHVNSRARSPLRALREMFASEADMPDRHATEYFAMDYRITPGAIHVISSGLDEEGWSRVPENTAVRVDLETREIDRLVDLPHAE